jgi:hypothetical protein
VRNCIGLLCRLRLPLARRARSRALASSLLISIDGGIGLSIALSLLVLIKRSFRATHAALGRIVVTPTSRSLNTAVPALTPVPSPALAPGNSPLLPPADLAYAYRSLRRYPAAEVRICVLICKMFIDVHVCLS